jgi:hypothetical protein
MLADRGANSNENPLSPTTNSAAGKVTGALPRQPAAQYVEQSESAKFDPQIASLAARHRLLTLADRLSSGVGFGRRTFGDIAAAIATDRACHENRYRGKNCDPAARLGLYYRRRVGVGTVESFPKHRHRA